jgi:hypothetical protein
VGELPAKTAAVKFPEAKIKGGPFFDGPPLFRLVVVANDEVSLVFPHLLPGF